MMIYGTAVLAGCLIAGMIVGDVLGTLLGVDSNVGGVGFAMLLLIVLMMVIVLAAPLLHLALPANKAITFVNSKMDIGLVASVFAVIAPSCAR